MPKKVDFVQCDCMEGKLEFLAATKKIENFSYFEYRGPGDCDFYRGSMKKTGSETFFYFCDNKQCGKIYSRYHYYEGTSYGHDCMDKDDLKRYHPFTPSVDKYGDWKLYKGLLTKKEIEEFAGTCCFGQIFSEDEQRIISQRKK